MTTTQTDPSVQYAWTDPSEDGPRLAFNNGQVSFISEVLNPVLPDIAGPVSADWHFTQWNPGSWFDPADTIVNPPLIDAVLGPARYGWQADGSSIGVFGSAGNYVYALTDGGGALRDLNLEAGVMPPASFSFDKQVTFTAQERISAASDLGPLDGASAANNFTVAFNRTDAADYDPNLPTISIFLQVELGVAGSIPKSFASFGTSAGNIYNVVPGSEGNFYLPGEADTGGLHDVTINLSGAVAEMTQWLVGADPSAGSAVLDLSRWSLTGEYIGIESSIGSSLTLDVAHPVVRRDPSQAAGVTTGPIVSIAGGLDAQAPVTIGIDAISATPSAAGVLSTGDSIVFTLAASSLLDATGTTATLRLSDGGTASFSGVNASGALTFIDRIAAGDASTDLKVVGLDLNGSAITDNEGAMLDVGSVARAAGADTGLVVQATAASVSGDVATFGGQAGAVEVTGDAYLDAHPAMQALVPSYATTGLNLLDAGMPHLLYIGNDLGVVPVFDEGASASIVVGDGSDLTYSGSGSVSIVGGLGNDTVMSGAGNDTISLGRGSNDVDLGSGDSLVYSAGTDLVQAGTGRDTVVVSGSNATVDGGYGGTLDVDDSNGANTTINVSAGATVTGASASVTTINAYGDTTVHGGAGGTHYNEQNGTMKFVGVGGSVTVSGGPAAGSDTLYGSEGSNIVLTSQSRDNVFVANDPRYGDGGNVTLNGAAAGGGNEFWAGSGNATLIGGTGGDTLVGGTGHTTIVGGSASAGSYFCLFSAGTGAGTELTIENFNAVSSNQLLLFNFGGGEAARTLAGATQTSSGTTLTLNDGATITLDGVSRSQLNAHNLVSM